MKTTQQGFTLIELVSVIVLLGILAVTALPRFVNLQDDARIAAVEGVGGAFKSAIVLANMKWIAAGHSGPVNELDIYGSGENLVDMNASGWPAQVWAGVEANPELGNTADCMSVWRAVLSDASPTVATDISQDYQNTYAANTCTFTLVDEPRLSIFYDSNSGVVTVDSTL